MKLSTIAPRLRTADTRRAPPPPKTADPFYLTPEWRKLMARLVTERGRKCQTCGRENCRVFGDHIREIRDGGALLDPMNVNLKCGACHSRKTAAARAERMRRLPEG